MSFNQQPQFLPRVTDQLLYNPPSRFKDRLAIIKFFGSLMDGERTKHALDYEWWYEKCKEGQYTLRGRHKILPLELEYNDNWK